MAKLTKGTPTGTNIFALVELFGDDDIVSARVDASTAPHIRRCMKAGLVDVVDGELVLTDFGVEAIIAYHDDSAAWAHYHAWHKGQNPGVTMRDPNRPRVFDTWQLVTSARLAEVAS